MNIIPASCLLMQEMKTELPVIEMMECKNCFKQDRPKIHTESFSIAKIIVDTRADLGIAAQFITNAITPKNF